MKTYYVLDTSSLLRLIRDQDKLLNILQDGFIAITKEVYEEIKDRSSRLFLNAIIDRISIINPSPQFRRETMRRARDIGCHNVLSKTDLSVVALALELLSRNYDVKLLTEDFEIQNMCKFLKIPYSSVTDKVIKKILKTFKKCLVCGETYESSLSACPNCGSLKYKLIKTRADN